MVQRIERKEASGTPRGHLEVLRAKYEGAMRRPEFYTPAFQTQLWREMFTDDPSIIVPDCNWAEEEMKRPMLDVKGNPIAPMMVYKPDKFKGTEGLIRLGRRYPNLGSRSVQEGTTIKDKYNTRGWIKVEGSLDAPNLDTTEADLGEHAKDQGYNEQREGTYILLGQALFVLTGQYPDIRTFSRLPGSRSEGSVVCANRYSDGYLNVGWNGDPQARNPYLGGRFEEVEST